MSQLRSVLTIVLLCGFAALGASLGIISLVLFGVETTSGSAIGAVLDGFGVIMIGAALLLVIPAAVALALRPRRPMVSNAVASMLGVGVFAVTAEQATSEGSLLAVNLAGLALVLCALPIPERPKRAGEPQ